MPKEQRGITITTYLVNSNPSSVKNIFLSNKLITASIVPRTEIPKIQDRPEAESSCLYFLIKEDNDQPKIYIGETEGFYKRLNEHIKDEKKDFDTAISFYTKDDSLNKAYIKYLEYLSINSINKTPYVTNQNTPKANKLEEYQIDEVLNFFDDVKLITNFLGYPFFRDNKNNAESDKLEDTIFYCKRGNIDAKMQCKNGLYIVLAGSQIKNKDNNLETTTDDAVFKTPSGAACFCINNSANGWIEWKTKDDITLSDFIGRNLSDSKKTNNQTQ